MSRKASAARYRARRDKALGIDRTAERAERYRHWRERHPFSPGSDFDEADDENWGSRDEVYHSETENKYLNQFLFARSRNYETGRRNDSGRKSWRERQEDEAEYQDDLYEDRSAVEKVEDENALTDAMVEDEARQGGLHPIAAIKKFLNRVKNTIKHPFAMKRLKEDARLARMENYEKKYKRTVGPTQRGGKYGYGHSGYFPGFYPPMGGYGMPMPYPLPRYDAQDNFYDSYSEKTNEVIAPDITFSEQQKYFWRMIKANSTHEFSNPLDVPYEAQGPSVVTQMPTVANPYVPEPRIYEAPEQEYPEYDNEPYPYSESRLPDLDPRTNQIRVRAQNKPRRSIVDDAKDLAGRARDKIDAYLESKGIDKEKAKKAAIMAALGGLGLVTTGTVISRNRARSQNRELRAMAEDLRDQVADLSDKLDRAEKRSRRKSRDDHDDYDRDYDDDRDDDRDRSHSREETARYLQEINDRLNQLDRKSKRKSSPRTPGGRSPKYKSSLLKKAAARRDAANENL